MRTFWGKSLGGLILIAVGVVFLLHQTGVIDVELNIGYIVGNFWPVILIYIGLCGLFVQRKYDQGWGFSYLWNLVMIGLGLVFLNNNFGWVPNFGFRELFKFAVPVIIILVGLNMLFRRPKTPPYRPRDWEPYSSNNSFAGQEADRNKYQQYGEAPHAGTDQDAYTDRAGNEWKSDWNTAKENLKEVKQNLKEDLKTAKNQWKEEMKEAKENWKQERRIHSCKGYDWHGAYSSDVEQRHNFIGDLRIGQDYWELKPMNISHFIGDTELDLTKANIPFGETRINVSAFIGDVKVFVPNDVQLEVSVTASSFLGDIHVFQRREGGMFRNMRAESPYYREADKRVHINVSMFIGDVKVKRVG